MPGGAIGYARRMLLARRVGRSAMVVTLALTVSAVLVAIALGWAGESVASIAVAVLLLGCLVSCGLVWLTEARASREIQEQVAAMAEQRAARRRDGVENR